MGNTCGCHKKGEFDEYHLGGVIKFQAIARSYLARKKKNSLKLGKIKHLFSKCDEISSLLF